mmetsp:Transcript_8887/g.25043  ORF Transcript_8887/g.25043 Transcript_8887/m.25043 type:complete len:663 (+) Transcript_8887:248-2236(+)
MTRSSTQMLGLLSVLLAVVAAALLPAADAFYMPGVKPLTFQEGDEVPMKVNAMSSIHTQLPKDYYRLPFCVPEGGAKMASENLGEFLTGNKIQNSPYTINMKRETYCQILCQIQLSKVEARNLRMHIRYGYHNNWIIDNIPSAAIGLTEAGHKQKHYAGGFPIGFVDAGSGDAKDAYVYNHVNINIDYHKPDASTTTDDGYRVVGFAVEPMSIAHYFLGGYDWDGKSSEGYTKSLATCSDGSHMTRDDITSNQIVQENEKVVYTYDVIWNESDVAWSSRWDVYLSEDHLVPAQVHWYSITNSILVVLFLSLLIISILVRNLRRDYARYNKLATDEEKAEDLEEFGWKLVHADVFRPPSFSPMLLAVCCGTGAQLLCMAVFTILFAAMGFLSPANRGALLMAQLLLYVLLGSVAGYTTARLYKTFKGKSWQKATTLTSLGFPGVAFFIFFIMNIIALSQGSSDAVPFTTMLVLLILWFGISTPLVFFGAYFGYKQEAIEFPVNTSNIPRQIPDQPWFMGIPFTLLVGGILPFGACFVELYFILSSVWMDQYYYVFGFLLLVFIILVVTCAEITVLFCYFQLCGENYHWWWRSFCTAGSTALYVFFYSFVYFKQLEASKTAATYVLYFGYMGLASLALFLMTGYIGVASSLWFNKTVFASIKID